MIVTCASCLTKFHLDDSRIPPKGVKVRCSRCKHIFFITPSVEGGEKASSAFEPLISEERTDVSKRERGTQPSLEAALQETKASLPPKREIPSPPPTPPETKEERPLPPPDREIPEAKPSVPTRFARSARRGPSSVVLALVLVLLLLLFGFFYLSTELGSGGILFSYIEGPANKIKDLWNQLWGIEKQGLLVGDLNRYEETVGGGIPISVIEGKVTNQSDFTKRWVRLRVVIYDSEKNRVAQKEAICGRKVSRQEMKLLPPEAFGGEKIFKPDLEREMVLPPGKSAPFVVAFKDLPPHAKEFKIEILEAPNL
jgi:predicted Zn finger-like uncharacterized protein